MNKGSTIFHPAFLQGNGDNNSEINAIQKPNATYTLPFPVALI
jgi:hypothetical protein